MKWNATIRESGMGKLLYSHPTAWHLPSVRWYQLPCYPCCDLTCVAYLVHRFIMLTMHQQYIRQLLYLLMCTLPIYLLAASLLLMQQQQGKTTQGSCKQFRYILCKTINAILDEGSDFWFENVMCYTMCYSLKRDPTNTLGRNVTMVMDEGLHRTGAACCTTMRKAIIQREKHAYR